MLACNSYNCNGTGRRESRRHLLARLYPSTVGQVEIERRQVKFTASLFKRVAYGQAPQVTLIRLLPDMEVNLLWDCIWLKKKN